MSLNDPQWGRKGGGGPGGTQGPPDLDELWRSFNQRLNGIFGRRGGGGTGGEPPGMRQISGGAGLIAGLILGLGGNSFLFSGLSKREDGDPDELERLEVHAAPPRTAANPWEPAELTKAWDAREVLGVGPRASRHEVERAFRARMRQYDPAQVAHLGPELRELAERKAEEIHAAREALTRFGQ